MIACWLHRNKEKHKSSLQTFFPTRIPLQGLLTLSLIFTRACLAHIITASCLPETMCCILAAPRSFPTKADNCESRSRSHPAAPTPLCSFWSHDSFWSEGVERQMWCAVQLSALREQFSHHNQDPYLLIWPSHLVRGVLISTSLSFKRYLK